MDKDNKKQKSIFLVLGLKFLRYNGKYDTIEFNPILEKDETVALFNPTNLTSFKRNFINEINKVLPQNEKIRAITSVKIRNVGDKEEEWI